MNRTGAHPLLSLYVSVVCVFVLAPVFIILAESVTSATYVSFPPVGFSLRWYLEIGRRPEFVDSIYVSAELALANSVLATLIGCLAALALNRYQFFGRAFLQGLFMSPLSLPAMVLGVALLQFYAAYNIRRGLITLLLAHLVITVPFSIRLITAALAGFDRSIERAAQSLGANQIKTFLFVTLPVLRAGIIGSVIFTFILSLDEVSMSLFLSSPQVTTLPVRVFSYIEQVYDPFITAISSVLILIATVIILVLEKTIGIARVFGIR